MSNNPFAFLEVEDLPDGCCKCAATAVKVKVKVAGQVYGFCPDHEHRGDFLQRGQQARWPELRVDGLTGKYAIEADPAAYFLTTICGNDERVIELNDALYELEEAREYAKRA